jgi:hypothetical protein
MHGVCLNTNPFRADEAGQSLPDGKPAAKASCGRTIKLNVRNFPKRRNQLRVPPINSLT